MPKLSEAIREGAKIRPQCFCTYSTTLSDGTIGTCAFGAAYEAVFDELPSKGTLPSKGIRESTAERLERAFGITFFAPLKNPVLHANGTLYCVISELNDDYGWSREQIADYLEQEGF